jgi:hypothetical protein
MEDDIKRWTAKRKTALIVDIMLILPPHLRARAPLPRPAEPMSRPLRKLRRGCDLPGFFGPMISRKMGPKSRGAYEEEPIDGRSDGDGAA